MTSQKRVLPFLLVFLVLLSAPNTAFTQEARGPLEVLKSVDFSGYVGPNAIKTRHNRDSLLNPQLEVIEFPEYEGELFSNLYADLYLSPGVSFVSKLRLSGIKREQPTYLIRQDNKLVAAEEEQSELDFDEAYFKLSLGNTFFATVGRVNLVKGEGLSYNPSFFFGEVNTTSDPTWSEEEKRVNQQGEYILQVEKFWRGYTLTGTVVPELDDLQDTTEVELKIATSVANTSLGASVFASEEQANFGFNVSSTVTDKLELHAELGLYSANNKKHLKIGDTLAPDVHEYVKYNPADEDEVYPEVLLGGHYTWENGTNLILEYFHNGKGYDDAEWKEFVDIAEENKNYLLNPPPGFSSNTDLFRRNLSRANDVTNFRRMRQHYLYSRLRNRKLYDNFDLSCGLLTNLEDESFVVLPAVNYSYSGTTEINGGANVLAGDSSSEFGLSPKQANYYAEVRYYF